MASLCPKKNECGSCGWSHIPYENQLAQKLSDLNGSFALKHLNLQCDTIIPSPKTEHYRNRMDFVIDFEGRVGLRQKGKWWRVIDDHTCFIADKRIESLFKELRAWVQSCGLSFYDRKSHEGFLRAAVIRSTTLGETLINLITSAPTHEHESNALTTFHPGESLSTLAWSVNHTDSDVSFGDETRILTGNGWIEEEMEGIRYRISPQAFFQTNSYAAPWLLKTVNEYCGDLSEKTLLDLYCGTGFFSTALASHAKQTIGVELNESAIEDARLNAEMNNVSVEYHVAATEGYDWSVHGADVVILDPPRSGMHDRALEDLLRIQPREIVYISCNPKNFAREMVQLQEVYHVEDLRAVDLFPHTPHVELVTKLSKK